MLHFYNTLPDFSTVGAGNKASLRVPNGPTYREFIINVVEDGSPATEAEIIANVELVEILINGIQRFAVTGARLLAIMKYYGIEFSAGELVIPLSRFWCRTKEGEENLGWGTRNVQTMHLKVKMGAGATNPQLSADCWLTPESRDLGTIIEVHEYPYEAVSAGKKEIPDLPKENGSLIALHLESQYITGLEVKLNKVPFIEDGTDLASYQRLLKRTAGRVPQSGFVHVDAMALNRIDDAWALKGLSEFRVNPTVSQAATINMVMETINTPLAPSAK